MRLSQVEKEKTRRQVWLLLNGPCQHCGSWERLEVDHINPHTKVRRDDSNVWGWSQQRREAELLKCQVLCRDCHKKKHPNGRYLKYPELIPVLVAGFESDVGTSNLSMTCRVPERTVRNYRDLWAAGDERFRNNGQEVTP